MRTVSMSIKDEFTGLSHLLEVRGITDETPHAQLGLFRSFLALQGYPPSVVNAFAPAISRPISGEEFYIPQ